MVGDSKSLGLEKPHVNLRICLGRGHFEALSKLSRLKDEVRCYFIDDTYILGKFCLEPSSKVLVYFIRADAILGDEQTLD